MMRRPLISAFLILLLPCLSLAGVTITVFNVGQGDATLVESTSGMTLLFDAGSWPTASNASTPILQYLNSKNIDSLDYIVVSHYHADHINAIVPIYNQKGANHGVWDRGWSYDGTATYRNYRDTVAGNRYTLTQFQVIDLGDGVTATVLALNGNGVLNPPFDNENLENAYSVALLIECGDFDFFQAGDLTGYGTNIETSVANTMLTLGKADIEVYRVNHHGSQTSSNTYFLNTTTPEVAIISCSANNSYNHPHEDPVVRMQQRGIHIYMTTAGNGYTLPPEDMTIVNGHIVIETTGFATYTVNGDIWEMDEPYTAVEDIPFAFALHGNYPNPFNPATVITFTSARGGPGQLAVYDIAGRRHWHTAFTAPAGDYQVTWQARDLGGRMLPAGVYLYEVILPDGRDRGRMVLAK